MSEWSEARDLLQRRCAALQPQPRLREQAYGLSWEWRRPNGGLFLVTVLAPDQHNSDCDVMLQDVGQSLEPIVSRECPVRALPRIFTTFVLPWLARRDVTVTIVDSVNNVHSSVDRDQ